MIRSYAPSLNFSPDFPLIKARVRVPGRGAGLWAGTRQQAEVVQKALPLLSNVHVTAHCGELRKASSVWWVMAEPWRLGRAPSWAPPGGAGRCWVSLPRALPELKSAHGSPRDLVEIPGRWAWPNLPWHPGLRFSQAVPRKQSWSHGAAGPGVMGIVG